MSISFPSLGKCFAIISLNKFSIHLVCISALSSTPWIFQVDRLSFFKKKFVQDEDTL
jgi:hypothetical protein